jgi:hypothetical protein
MPKRGQNAICRDVVDATRSVVVRISNEGAAIPEIVQLLAKRQPTVATR